MAFALYDAAAPIFVRGLNALSGLIDKAGEAGLVRIDQGSPYYWVADLTHSVPFVTPDAAAVLDSIGVRFQRKLAGYGLPPYAFTISSVLRTQEDQAALRGWMRQSLDGQSAACSIRVASAWGTALG